ncbi:hypothetical protein RFI_07530, partial [Reticulomyxa filosa]
EEEEENDEEEEEEEEDEDEGEKQQQPQDKEERPKAHTSIDKISSLKSSTAEVAKPSSKKSVRIKKNDQSRQTTFVNESVSTTLTIQPPSSQNTYRKEVHTNSHALPSSSSSTSSHTSPPQDLFQKYNIPEQFRHLVHNLNTTDKSAT